LISELGYTIADPKYATNYSIASGGFWDGSNGVVVPAFRHNDAKNSLFLDGHVGSNRADGSMNWNLFLN
ncbi:MAG: hypothetical protein ACF8OB_08585, partial [Phycisphaeraceae bacterium JB051]